MRRRFAWQGLFPSEPPVKNMLRSWLKSRGMNEKPADLLDALNKRIADRDAAVGPSYLMKDHVNTDAGLRRIWKHHVLPLLAERHFGEGVNVQAMYGIEALTNGTPLPLVDELTEELGDAI
jgi:5-methylcytosine-specific restriction protein B